MYEASYCSVCNSEVTDNGEALEWGYTKICRHHGTHVTDFIDRRRDEGGAINWCHL